MALNAARETLTTRKTVDQSSSLSYVNTDSSVPANDTEVRSFWFLLFYVVVWTYCPDVELSELMQLRIANTVTVASDHYACSPDAFTR